MKILDVPVGKWFERRDSVVMQRLAGETQVIDGINKIPAKPVSHLGPSFYVPADEEVEPYNLNFVRVAGVMT